MKKLLPILGCVLVALLMMPAFLAARRTNAAEASGQAIASEAFGLIGTSSARFPRAPAAIIRELRGENEAAGLLRISARIAECQGELLDPWGSVPDHFRSATGEPLIRPRGIAVFEPDDARRGRLSELEADE